MRKSLLPRIFLIISFSILALYPASPVSADTLTLRPNGTGDYTGISSQSPPSGAHWDKVDDASPDTTTYVYTTNNSQQKDAYQLENTAQTGTINSVTVYFRFRRSRTQSGSAAYCQPFLRLGTNETAGTEEALNSTTWTTYSQTLARPGGGNWTWTDINNLQVCIGLRDTGTGNRAARCTQTYIVVDYTPTPSLTVSISGNTTFCEGSSTTLTANASGGIPPYTYDWGASTAPGTYVDDEYTATGPGTVAVAVSDSSGCTESGTVVSDTSAMVTQGNVPGATYPHNAALAWVHPSWWGSLDYNFGYPSNTAQWIWESYYVVNPVSGDIVYFEHSFNIPGPPVGATLHITCDNGYEVYINPDINPDYIGRGQLDDYGGIPWEMSDLSEDWVHSSGWQSVEAYNISAAMLKSGTNILEVRAANELMESGSSTPEDNPGGLVYELVYEYSCTVTDSVEVTMNPAPIATASSNSPVEEGATIELYGGPDGMSSYSWTGPNGFSSPLQNPTIPNATTAMSGTYILTVTDSNGCQGYNSVTVTVNPASIPTVNAIDIWDNSGCIGPAVTSMDPQTTYYAKVSVSLSNNLVNLQTIEVTLFYNASGSDNMTAPIIADTQTCAILTCTVGTPPVWTIDSGTPTSWTIETVECVQPPLNATSGDWIFAFKPGKVATESVAPADWDAQGKATNKANQSGELYCRDKDMNWYGEIDVTTSTVDWGEVPLGLRFTDAPNPKTVSMLYISNGDYYEDIRSEDWTDGVETVTLDETGVDPPPLPGTFALKANDINELSSAVIVMSSIYNHTNDTGGLTTEAGITSADNTLWLSLSETGIAPVQYSGEIYYQIANRD